MRDYRKEYDSYQSRPAQIRNRSKRNAARRKMIKRRGKSALAGKDVDHVRGVGAGNGFKNLRIQSKHANRSFRRTRTGAVLRRK